MGLGNEIKVVEEQIESVRAEKQKGQDAVNEELERLDQLNEELGEIDDSLHTVVTEAALGSLTQEHHIRPSVRHEHRSDTSPSDATA